MVDIKASKIKLLFLDVDGVMTDGSIVINENGEEVKFFNIKDGQGIKMLIKGGVEVVIVTGKISPIVEHRASQLGILEVYQGVDDKRSLCLEVKEKKGLGKDEVASIGDDIPDLAMFMECGLRVAVSDAAAEVREQADFVTRNRGGNGAVREVCELILKSQKKWNALFDVVAGN